MIHRHTIVWPVQVRAVTRYLGAPDLYQNGPAPDGTRSTPDRKAGTPGEPLPGDQPPPPQSPPGSSPPKPPAGATADQPDPVRVGCLSRDQWRAVICLATDAGEGGLWINDLVPAQLATEIRTSLIAQGVHL
jgi:hypothetical protein